MNYNSFYIIQNLLPLAFLPVRQAFFVHIPEILINFQYISNVVNHIPYNCITFTRRAFRSVGVFMLSLKSRLISNIL